MPAWFRPTRMGRCFGATTWSAGEQGIASRPSEAGNVSLLQRIFRVTGRPPSCRWRDKGRGTPPALLYEFQRSPLAMHSWLRWDVPPLRRGTPFPEASATSASTDKILPFNRSGSSSSTIVPDDCGDFPPPCVRFDSEVPLRKPRRGISGLHQSLPTSTSYTRPISKKAPDVVKRFKKDNVCWEGQYTIPRFTVDNGKVKIVAAYFGDPSGSGKLQHVRVHTRMRSGLAVSTETTLSLF